MSQNLGHKFSHKKNFSRQKSPSLSLKLKRRRQWLPFKESYFRPLVCAYHQRIFARACGRGHAMTGAGHLVARQSPRPSPPEDALESRVSWRPHPGWTAAATNSCRLQRPGTRLKPFKKRRGLYIDEINSKKKKTPGFVPTLWPLPKKLQLDHLSGGGVVAYKFCIGKFSHKKIWYGFS